MSDLQPVSGIGEIDDPASLAARFARAYPPAQPAAGPAIYLPFHNGELVVRDDYALTLDPPYPLVNDEARENILYLGTLDGIPCLSYRLRDDGPIPDGFRAVGLRALYGHAGDEEYALAGYAAQLLNWRENYRFCSRCGSPAVSLDGGWAMICPVCEYTVYPPVSPAVLALVHDGGDKVLLAKKPGWGRRYSILAGFVEPGESLESCVIREVFEEAGVHAREVVYVGSQPWPFPHQLMVGFTAHHVGGEIKIDEAELEHADWFRFDALPELPPPMSLSRQIIDAWVASRNA